MRELSEDDTDSNCQPRRRLIERTGTPLQSHETTTPGRESARRLVGSGRRRPARRSADGESPSRRPPEVPGEPVSSGWSRCHRSLRGLRAECMAGCCQLAGSRRTTAMEISSMGPVTAIHSASPIAAHSGRRPTADSPSQERRSKRSASSAAFVFISSHVSKSVVFDTYSSSCVDGTCWISDGDSRAHGLCW